MASVSTLSDSARVVLADAYGDGTVSFYFEDAEGRHAFVCIDGRKGSPTRYRLFDMALHPTRPTAVLLELGARGGHYHTSRLALARLCTPP